MDVNMVNRNHNLIGTHPIPQKYYSEHERLGTWKNGNWPEKLKFLMCDEKTRKEYD
jgi:hypothetical protein